jgi:hypothetical protein
VIKPISFCNLPYVIVLVMPLNAYENQYENKQTAFKPCLSKKILKGKIKVTVSKSHSIHEERLAFFYQGRFPPSESLLTGKKICK